MGSKTRRRVVDIAIVSSAETRRAAVCLVARIKDNGGESGRCAGPVRTRDNPDQHRRGLRLPRASLRRSLPPAPNENQIRVSA